MKSIMVDHLVFAPGMMHICVPITGESTEQILEQVREVKRHAPDLVEWRGDLFEDISDIEKTICVAGQVRDLLGDIPLLFTFRSQKEGGAKSLCIEDYIRLNRAIASSDAVSLIDVEGYMDRQKMHELIEDIHKCGKRVIGSHHRFDGTPEQGVMVEALKYLEDIGADIVKLAVMPHTEADVEALIAATKEAAEHQVECPVVTMSMGTLGVRTRIEGKNYGSCMTFGCVGSTSAPGQLELEELRKRIKCYVKK